MNILTIDGTKFKIKVGDKSYYTSYKHRSITGVTSSSFRPVTLGSDGQEISTQSQVTYVLTPNLHYVNDDVTCYMIASSTTSFTGNIQSIAGSGSSVTTKIVNNNTTYQILALTCSTSGFASINAISMLGFSSFCTDNGYIICEPSIEAIKDKYNESSVYA